MPRTPNDVMREIADLCRRAERQNLLIKRFHVPTSDMKMIKMAMHMIKPAPRTVGIDGMINGIAFVENNTHGGRIWVETAPR